MPERFANIVNVIAHAKRFSCQTTIPEWRICSILFTLISGNNIEEYRPSVSGTRSALRPEMTALPGE
jgi:hypothetical protein